MSQFRKTSVAALERRIQRASDAAKKATALEAKLTLIEQKRPHARNYKAAARKAQMACLRASVGCDKAAKLYSMNGNEGASSFWSGKSSDYAARSFYYMKAIEGEGQPLGRWAEAELAKPLHRP